MVNVTFLNPTTGQRLVVEELDEEMTVLEAIQNLVEQCFIPPPQEGTTYSLAIRGKGELSDYAATLASGNICTGDVVMITRAQRGGGGILPPETLDLAAKVGIPVATGFAGGLAAWLTARNGRKVRLKTAKLEIEAPTVDELKEVLAVAEKHLRRKAKPSLPKKRR